MNVRLIGTEPRMMRQFKSAPGTVACTGDDCPVCRLHRQLLGHAQKKEVFNVIDKQDGKVKQMVMNESQVDALIGKVRPKGRCFHVRLGSFEARFWTMWWKLSWREKRKVTTTEFQSLMFGPWEFRRYW